MRTKSTYVVRGTTTAFRTAVRILKARAEASIAAIPILSLRMYSPLVDIETILVWEIILGELVHHLGICSRLIIATHLVEVAVAKTCTHAVPSIAITTTVVHHVHGSHIVHAHAHVPSQVAIHT